MAGVDLQLTFWINLMASTVQLTFWINLHFIRLKDLCRIVWIGLVLHHPRERLWNGRGWVACEDDAASEWNEVTLNLLLRKGTRNRVGQAGNVGNRRAPLIGSRAFVESGL